MAACLLRAYEDRTASVRGCEEECETSLWHIFKQIDTHYGNLFIGM